MVGEKALLDRTATSGKAGFFHLEEESILKTIPENRLIYRLRFLPVNRCGHIKKVGHAVKESEHELQSLGWNPASDTWLAYLTLNKFLTFPFLNFFICKGRVMITPKE